MGDSLRTLFFAAASCAELAACGEGGDGGTTTSPPPPPQAGNCRYESSLTVEKSMVIVDPCTIQGDLVVKNAAALEVDYSRKEGARFVVVGNVTVEDRSTFWVHGSAGARGVFVVANEFSQHRSMISKGDATIKLEHVEFETQANIDPGKGSVYMSYEAKDRSSLVVDDAKVVGERAWLLANFHDRSSLRAVDTDHLPNEIYVHDSSSIRVSGSRSRTGLWLDAGGAQGTLTLPDVTGPYTWKAGSNSGLNVGWALEVDNAQPGLGVEIRPGSSLTIDGKGAHAPVTGELKISYFVVGGSETLQGFKAGLQNGKVSDRLTLNHVQLGPIAWQMYAGDDANLTIKDSTINEIGIFGKNANVKVDHCILQLAVLAALGPGSTLEISDSEIWNQSAEAANKGKVTISNSNIYGTLFHARDSGSSISIFGGAFHENPSGCTESTMVNIATGQPKCNPFRPPGLPQATGAGKVTCVATTRCTF